MLGLDAPRVDAVIGGLTTDSRQVRTGDCFCALSGTQAQGAAFVSDAIARGAVAILVDSRQPAPVLPVPVVPIPHLRERLGIIAAHLFGNPSRHLSVAAITGTNGKTTVAHLCAQALSALGTPCGYIGTLGAGALEDLQPTGLTTPDPLRLQAEMARMLARGITAMAVEASSHALAQSRLAGTAIETAVFTGLGHDHLDYHGDHRAYLAAKKRLFEHPGLRHAVLNADDEATADLVQTLHEDVSLTSFSLHGRALKVPRESSLQVRDAVYTAQGSALTVLADGREAKIRSQLIGDINAQNLLAVLGILLSRDVPLDDAARVLAQVVPVCGRLERFGGQRGQPLVFVDYAHSPDSLARVLQILQAFAPPRLVCVFGCGGDRDRSKRPLMGRIAAHYADDVIVTTDNPRSEDPDAIAQEILGANGADASRCTVIHDRTLAIETALATAGPGTIVLVAGKGHETEQETAGRRSPQSDQATVRSWLERHP